MEGTTPTITTLLESLTSIFDFVVDCAGSILDLMVENPLLILMIPGFIGVGYVVSWVGKLIRQ